MTVFISHTTVDCRNAYELSEWWKPVLGYVDIDGDPNLPGHEECMVRDPGTGHQLHQLLFIEVPDDQSVKDRVHLDRNHRGNHGPGTGWVVLADPEGNEFCILRSEAEIEASQS